VKKRNFIQLLLSVFRKKKKTDEILRAHAKLGDIYDNLGAHWEPMTWETMKKVIEGPVQHYGDCIIVEDPR